MSSKKRSTIQTALITGGLFFILFLGWLKLGDIYGTDRPPQAYEVMDYLEKNHFLSMQGLRWQDLQGKSFDPAQLPQDRIYILNFWATWCEPCAEEFPSMVKLLKAYEGKIHIIAVSNDSKIDDIHSFAKAFGLSGQQELTLLWDPKLELAESFGVNKLPESFIFDRQGRLIKKIVGTRDWAAADAMEYFKLL